MASVSVPSSKKSYVVPLQPQACGSPRRVRALEADAPAPNTRASAARIFIQRAREIIICDRNERKYFISYVPRKQCLNLTK